MSTLRPHQAIKRALLIQSKKASGVADATDLGHCDPLLDDLRPLGGAAGGDGLCGVAQQRGDDPVGDGVELGNGGAHGRGDIAVLLLVSLGPDATDAVERDDFNKELL